MSEPIIRRAAQRDLRGHAAYVAADNRKAAQGLYDAAEEAFKNLAAMPELGAVYELENPQLKGLRAWPIRGYENYVVFYLPQPDGVAIVRVLHGMMDIDRILESEP